MENQSFMQKHELLMGWVIGILITAFTLVFIGWVINYTAHGLRNYSRGQKRADAQNQVAINEIQIKQTAQLVQVQTQKAQVRVEEAKGIAESQRLINNTLTPLYLQHEAIQSQESQSNKIIYVPSGNQGIPMVQTVNPQ